MVFLNSLILPVYPFSLMPEFLFELGLRFYQQGRYDEALYEFKKALLVKPDYEPALKYIQMIQEKEGMEPLVIPEKIPVKEKEIISRAGAIKEMLDLIELEKEMISQRQPSFIPTPAGLPEVEAIPKKVIPVNIIRLDDSLSQILQPIEIEQGKSIVVVGKNIQRFLVTQPDILIVDKKSPDELLVTGKNIGYTYLHIWDDNGRWTTEWLGIFAKPEGPTYEEVMRREAEVARNFKLRYTLDWSSYESGRRISNFERSSYSYTHGLSLTGVTPYGNLDSSLTVQRLTKNTDLTYLTLGLIDGKIGPFKGFTLRGFDYSPYFSNLALPGITLRGAMLASPAFDNRLDYTAFWGRESGGRYGGLSPSMKKTLHSFLEGVNMNFSPVKQQNYKFTLVHGWGRDRSDFLNAYDYDLSGSWNFNKLGWGYEVANDSETFAHLFNARYTKPKLNLSAELRNIDKDFYSIIGRGWRAGELGGLFNLIYKPTEKLTMNSRLEAYQDRLYPAEDNHSRWNQDFSWNTSYQTTPDTSWGSSYTMQNKLGTISQYRYQSLGLHVSRKFKFLKDIYTYADYYHQENKNFSTPASDYINDQVYLGLRFSLPGKWYYYINNQLNWLNERYTATWAHPKVMETGLDWSEQFGRTPLSGSFRFTYHNEEDTLSNLSFLSGEDYIEGYSELTYRIADDKQVYGSCRMRNVWADNPAASKRIEASFNAGMRYLWDTGLRWDSVCNIEGYIFKDLNFDGLRERDEAPVEGIKLWLGKDKSAVTDIFGYYKFKNVRGRKAYVNLDTSTIPSGFVLTVPAKQEILIQHNRTLRLDFGIASRCEISGFVFEDVDGNGEYNYKDDKGIRGVVITLEDGSQAVTEENGRYSFTRVSAGEHTVTLDLNSLPVYYIPQTTLTKKITLFEGVTYNYNIPLQRAKE